jgi:hypothetical protein
MTRLVFRLLTIIGTASLITTGIYFGLIFLSLPFLQRPNPPRVVQMIVLPVVVLTPVITAAWWIFKKLRSIYPPRVARTIAVVFGLFTPVSLGVAFPLSLLVGAYSEGLGGYPAFGLIGAIVGIVIMTAILGFVPCAFALWITQRDRGGHQTS